MTTRCAPELSQNEVIRFGQDGYLRIEQISPPDEIAWFSELYTRILENPFGKNLKFDGDGDSESSGTLTQVLRPEQDFPEILDTQYFRNARRLACTLMNVEEADLVNQGSMMIFKPAGSGRSTPWHQDEAYWDQPNVEANTVSCWMPLEEATVDSGCMQFIPASHKLGIMQYHQPGPGRPLILDDAVDVSGAVACPLPPGGATFHHCRTLHYTAPNTSTRMRRAISAVFDAPTRPIATSIPRPWLPLQVVTEGA